MFNHNYARGHKSHFIRDWCSKFWWAALVIGTSIAANEAIKLGYKREQKKSRKAFDTKRGSVCFISKSDRDMKHRRAIVGTMALGVLAGNLRKNQEGVDDVDDVGVRDELSSETAGVAERILEKLEEAEMKKQNEGEVDKLRQSYYYTLLTPVVDEQDRLTSFRYEIYQLAVPEEMKVVAGNQIN